MDPSNLSYLELLEDLRVTITEETTLSYPSPGFSCSSNLNSVSSPSHTSLVSLILNPIALLKFSYKTSVFLTSDEYTSEATIGQNGTFGPSSYEIAKAMAVLPVPGGPAKSRALPAIFFYLIISTMIPQPSLAAYCPTSPPLNSTAAPVSSNPRPLT
jgi:hypothetical protein